MNNLPKVVVQQHRGRASNPRPLYRKFDALQLSHCATPTVETVRQNIVEHYHLMQLSTAYTDRYTYVNDASQYISEWHRSTEKKVTRCCSLSQADVVLTVA